MNVLVLGHNGFIGNVLCKKMKNTFHVYTLNSDIRIGNERFIDDLMSCVSKNKINVIINCIAKANVDDCEKNQDESKEVNFLFVTRLVQALQDTGIHLVHISTNAVYSGENPPYIENSKREPCNYYGKCKAQADDYIESKSEKFTILRPITVYGYNETHERYNPVSFYIKKLSKNESLSLVDDNIVNMIHVNDFVNCVIKVIAEEKFGTFNLSGDISENRYELGLRICNVCGFNPSLITKVSGDLFPTLAKRAKNTTFDNSKMKIMLNVTPRDLDVSILEIYKEMIDKHN